MAKKRSIQKPAAPWEITASMFLSEDEVNRLIEHIRNSETAAEPLQRARATVDRLIIEILLFSGLRNSELCQLRIGDTEMGHGQPYLLIAAGTEQQRTVFIPGQLSHEILDYIKGVRGQYVTDDNSMDDVSQILILNERGRPYDRTALYRRVVRILTSAGLEDRASVQLLRHSYGFLAYKRTGGNLLFVQQQLGHAHPMVTAVYARFVSFSYSKLADDVGDEIFQPGQSPVKNPVKRVPRRKDKQ